VTTNERSAKERAGQVVLHQKRLSMNQIAKVLKHGSRVRGALAIWEDHLAS
jgi:hypothetical protein